MALVTAYLARTAQRKSGHIATSIGRRIFDQLAMFWRVTGQALTEAQEMRRAMAQKHPFTDI